MSKRLSDYTNEEIEAEAERREKISDDLYSICYEAYEHAGSTCYKPGDNYWMVMFVDKLKEKGVTIR